MDHRLNELDSEISFSLKTFGCKVNTYDSSVLEGQLQTAGLTRKGIGKDKDEKTSVHVLNSCAVTAEATTEVLREARRIKRNDPRSLVVVTGCSAQVDVDRLTGADGVDLVVANSHKGELSDLIKKTLSGELTEKVYRSNIFKKEDFEPGGGTESTKTRTFLKIQDGCNSFCTYCVIPFARGKSRSLSVEALTQRVREVHELGFNEVVLTGVHIGDYEFGLVPLIESILANTKIPRIRLSSFEPLEVTESLLHLFKDPRLCPHFHMSIQSAETSVLKGMKRVYTAEDVEASLKLIQRHVPNVFIGMDVIVGFPGETDDNFFETYKRLSELPWTRIHVFPYSERPGTFALKLGPKVPQHLIQHRAERLRELSSTRMVQMARQQIGTLKSVLYIKDKSPQCLAADYWPVEISGGSVSSAEGTSFQQGELLHVRITDVVTPHESRMDGYLRGELVE